MNRKVFYIDVDNISVKTAIEIFEGWGEIKDVKSKVYNLSRFSIKIM